MFIKLVILHDLKIILKSGTSIIVKNVLRWAFSESSYDLYWQEGTQPPVAWINPSEIAAVQVVNRKTRIARKTRAKWK